MDKTGWKITAIVFISILVFWLALSVWIYYEERNEALKEAICYYDICVDYPEATLVNKLCTCYDYDTLGYLVETKTEFMYYK